MDSEDSHGATVKYTGGFVHSNHSGVCCVDYRGREILEAHLSSVWGIRGHIGIL